MTNKIDKAIAGLIYDSPMFTSILLPLKRAEDSTTDSIWVDGKHLGYNSEFIESLPLPQIKGLLVHEAMHIIGAHHLRRGSRDHGKWNIAADYAINQIILDSGFELPPGVLLKDFGPDAYAEKIYNLLPDDKPKKDDQGDGGPRDPGKKKSAPGEVRDYPGEDKKPGEKATPQELKQAEADLKVKVAQAMQVAKSCGGVPGGIERIVEDLLDTVFPWKETLIRFVDTRCRNDYSWERPNKRFISLGIILPTLYNQEIETICVGVDTSGSISSHMLKQPSAELTAIMREFKAKIRVYHVDSRLQRSEEFEPDGDDIRLSPIGGGGTDFRPAFEEIDRLGLTPSCMIYFTDGYCSSFPESPGYPVLWGIIGNNKNFNPPFGEVMRIQLDE